MWWSRGSVVVIATDHGLEDRRVEFESRKGEESLLLHFVQTGSGAHRSSYSIGTGGFFPEAKAEGA
jgi:hypothetical protein